jgi:type I restriction enzyme, S subunit
MKEEKNISELPKDWKRTKLGELCEIVSGNTPKGLETVSNKGRFQFYKVSDMNLEGNETSMTTSNLRLTEGEIKDLRIKAYPKGTVIFPKRGGAILTNKKRILSQAASFDLNIMGILPNENVGSAYLYYWFQKLDLTKIYDGSNVPQINNKNIAPLEFPLPTIEEQQQIVSKIEELFSELDKSIEELKTAQQQLKVYRQAVLKWAFEGKLTNQDVKNGELPRDWKRIKLEDIAIVGTGATPLKSRKEYYENGTIAWVTSGALNEEYVNKATGYVTEKALKETNLSVYPKHTLLLAMYGEGKTRGKCSELMIDASTNQAIAAISFEKHDVRVKPFLKYYLLKNYNDIRMLSSGGVQPNLNLGIVKRTIIPFPPLEEQQQIVQEIESRLSVCDKLEETITYSLKQAEALRQSILKKAFEGELC